MGDMRTTKPVKELTILPLAATKVGCRRGGPLTTAALLVPRSVPLTGPISSIIHISTVLEQTVMKQFKRKPGNY